MSERAQQVVLKYIPDEEKDVREYLLQRIDDKRAKTVEPNDNMEDVLDKWIHEIYDVYVDHPIPDVHLTSELGLSILRIAVWLNIYGHPIYFPTIVHAFEHHKVEYDIRNLKDGTKVKVAQRLTTMTLKEVLKWGQENVQMDYNEWKPKRVSVMEAVVYEAVLQNADLCLRLLRTTGEIREDTTPTWNYPGNNTLGKIWMSVRDRVRDGSETE